MTNGKIALLEGNKSFSDTDVISNVWLKQLVFFIYIHLPIASFSWCIRHSKENQYFVFPWNMKKKSNAVFQIKKLKKLKLKRVILVSLLIQKYVLIALLFLKWHNSNNKVFRKSEKHIQTLKQIVFFKFKMDREIIWNFYI